MSSTPPSCSHCQRLPSESESASPVCSRCRTARFCSTACQCSAWKSHKKGCQPDQIQTTPSKSLRTSTPQNWMIFSGPPWADNKGINEVSPIDADVIYYLRMRISKPYIQDIFFLGPLYPVECIYEQMHSRLSQRDKSIPGFAMFSEELASASMASIEHLDAPLPDGKVMTLQILREKNKEVAGFLRERGQGRPNVTYSIHHVAVDPIFVASRYITGEGAREGHESPFNEAYVYATFTSRDAAKASARELVAKWKTEIPGAQCYLKEKEPGPFIGYQILDGMPRRMLEVRMDDGQKTMAVDGTVIHQPVVTF